MRKNKNTLLKWLRYISLASVIAFGFITIIATGGGGGGENSPGISYTGLTTQATIDQDNADDLSIGAYSGGKVGAVSGGLGGIQFVGGSSNDRLRLFHISQVLEGSLCQVDPGSKINGSILGAIVTERGTIPGDCGGNVNYTINVDDRTGNFDGSLNFYGYCYLGVAITGNVRFSGRVNLATRLLLTYSYSFSNLNGNIDGDSITMSGDILFDATASPIALTIDALIKDNNSGDVCHVNDYEMTLTEGAGYIDIGVSGRFYEPNYGYVEVSTIALFRIYDGNDNPGQGVLVAAGENNTKARLTILSDTTLLIEADTNGDETYEYNSGVLNWSDI